jgi:hypothetical protein
MRPPATREANCDSRGNSPVRVASLSPRSPRSRDEGTESSRPSPGHLDVHQSSLREPRLRASARSPSPAAPRSAAAAGAWSRESRRARDHRARPPRGRCAWSASLVSVVAARRACSRGSVHRGCLTGIGSPAQLRTVRSPHLSPSRRVLSMMNPQSHGA